MDCYLRRINSARQNSCHTITITMEHPAIEDPGGRGAVLFASVEKSKRQAVVGACERCRSKKIKVPSRSALLEESVLIHQG